MHLFLCPDLDRDPVELPEEEAHHAVHVLRVRQDQEVMLVDGRGTRARARILQADKKGCIVQVIEREQVMLERRARIHMAVAPTKQIDRFEWFVEKAVEIGVDRITPLMTERTERTRLRTDRLMRVVVSALKQSQRAWLPVIDEPLSLDTLMATEHPAQRLFGWCEGERSTLVERYLPKADALLLIGPEGDFTPDEAQQLVASGFAPVSLGEARLRTETAALAACTWMNFAQQAR